MLHNYNNKIDIDSCKYFSRLLLSLLWFTKFLNIYNPNIFNLDVFILLQYAQKQTNRPFGKRVFFHVVITCC